MPTTSFPNETTPIVDPQTLAFRRAITSPEQGYSVCQRLKQDSWPRLEKQAAIMRKFNDEQPFKQNKLAAANQSWRRNASTGFLSSMVKRILPPYDQVIDNAQYLTMSRFPGDETTDPDQVQKQSDFRAEITKTIRGWQGWQPFKNQVILEDVLFGYTGGGWTDEYTWQPRFLRQDDAYFPDGCSQEARLLPLWCLDQNFQIHEMANYLVDPEASELAGWNIEEVVLAINDARPENRASGTTQDIRKFEDLVRETSIGTSYSQGVKVIKAVHLFVQEVSGKVSHYIYNDRNGKLLFVKLDRFNAMEDNIALMAMEVGNGKLHGSKGAGRVLYNTHVSIDQARNLITDNLYLSGLLVLKQGEGAKPQQALTVVHPIAIIGKGFDVIQQKWEINTDAYFAIDRQMTQIAELQVGAFMPGQLTDTSGEKRTASEINYVASIEQQLREGLIARFYAQFQGGIIWQMQKRICSIDNLTAAYKLYQKEQAGVIQSFTQGVQDLMKALGQMIKNEPQLTPATNPPEAAIQCCLSLLRKSLTAQEIYTLGQAPAFDLTQDTAKDLSDALTQLKATYTGNPNVNQVELDRRHIASMVGEELADKLIIDQQDNTLSSEAARLQLMELPLLLQNEPVPVSPRDFDPVHLQVLQQKAQEAFAHPEGLTPEAIPALMNVLQHAQAHIQQGIAKAGGDKASFAPFIQFIQQAEKALGDAQAIHQHIASGPAANPRAVPLSHASLPPGASNGAAPPIPPSTEIQNPATAAQDKPLSRTPLPSV